MGYVAGAWHDFAVLTGLVGGVINAWLFLVRLHD